MNNYKLNAHLIRKPDLKRHTNGITTGEYRTAEKVGRMGAQADHKNVEGDYSFTDGLGDIAFGIGALAEMIEDEPDDEYYPTSERKQLAKEIKHKEELGLKM